MTAKSAALIISVVMGDTSAAFSTLRWRFADHCTGSTCTAPCNDRFIISNAVWDASLTGRTV